MSVQDGQKTSVGTQYMFTRGFRDSARLHLQHWIYKEHLGYLIHPAISLDESKPARIADLGTGNGCWLLDVAQSVPSNWSLEGFDVSNAQYPVRGQLPSNVSLEVMDSFDPPPQHLCGVFDLVHIRAFAAVVKNGDPDVLLRNLIAMVKPGGFLQWDEFDTGSFAAHAAPGASKANADEIIRTWYSLAERLSLRFEWMSPGAMEANFVKHGLTMVNNSLQDRWTSPASFKPLLRKAYTDNWMMALEETVFLIIGRDEIAKGITSPAEFSALLDRVVQETKNGVSIWIDFQIVVGQKQRD